MLRVFMEAELKGEWEHPGSEAREAEAEASREGRKTRSQLVVSVGDKSLLVTWEQM